MTTQVAFIGGGNMATSIIGGLVKSVAGQAPQVQPDSILVSDPGDAARQQLEQQFAVQTTTDNQQAATADIIVLAVKPQVMQSVVEPLREQLAQHQPLIISVAAGIDLAALSRWSGCQNIVRCMPNTPALLGQGATGLFASEAVTLEQRNQTDALLSPTGVTVWVQTEAEIDAVTALSGSGPAYYFLMMESMIQAGIELGLSPETAEKLTLQTAVGAGIMAQSADISPAELRRRVTSPRGTTEQAIQSFERSNLAAVVKTAMQAARDRAQELSQELGQADH